MMADNSYSRAGGNPLPEGWCVTPLSSLVSIIRGVTYNKSQSSDVELEGYLPVLRANNIQNDQLQLKDFVFVKSELIKEIQKIRENDILVAMSSGSKSVVGKTARSSTNLDAGFGAFCGLLRPDSSIEAILISYFTRSAYYRNKVSELSSGANINNLKPSHFDEISCPLPPLAEQKVIAEKLDTLLAQVDTTKARLERIPDIIKRFRQSVLAAAVSGKLTEEWVVDRLILSDVADFQNGYAFKSGWFENDGEYQVIKLGNIRDGCLAIENSPAYLKKDVAKDYIRFSPEPGDTLISMTGTRFKKDYGFGCLVQDEKNLLVNQRVGRLIPKKPFILDKFLNVFVRSDSFRDQFFKGETGGVNQGNVGSKHIMNIDIELPDIEKQTEIVRRVEELFAFADSIEQKAAAALERVNNLTQSILAKAFRGELVPQDPRDEPASQLLERIGAGREATQPKKKTR